MTGRADELTRRQRQILDLIKAHLRETGAPPTRREIAAVCGFNSPNSAEGHLRALARRGVIELTRGRSRGIRLTDRASSADTGVGGV